MHYWTICRKTLPDREMSMCKDPEAGVCLECLRKGKKAKVAGVTGKVKEMMSKRWPGKRCVGPSSPLQGLWHLL